MDLDVCKIRMDTKGKIRWQSPWCSCPGKQRHSRIIDKGERNGHCLDRLSRSPDKLGLLRTCRVIHIAIILPSLEVRQWCSTSSGIRHDSLTSINKILLEQLGESPPAGFHKRRVQSFIVIVEVNPATHPLDSTPPFRRVTHDNGTTFSIVYIDTHGHDIFFTSNAELLVNFVLNRQSMRIPTKTASYMKSADVRMSCNDILIFQVGISRTHHIYIILPL